MGNLIQKSSCTNGKNIEAFDTRFTKCSCQKLPIIAEKAKILEQLTVKRCQKKGRGEFYTQFTSYHHKNFIRELLNWLR